MNQDKINEYKVNTLSLKDLFEKVNNSGKIAWRVGAILKKVKDSLQYKIDYQTFDNYTNTEFNKSPQTANVYISIHESFSLDEISEHTLVTYLKTIIDFKDSKLGKIILQALGEIDKSGEKLPSNSDIHTTMRLLSKSNNITPKQVKQVLQNVKNTAKEAKSKKKKNKAKIGEYLKNTKFPELEKNLDYEPVDEQGLVALFCCLFPLLKTTKFDLQEKVISFDKIQYIRSAFPDASIRCQLLNKRKSYFENLNVEFEFESSNYLSHKHLFAENAKECDIIIAWEDNLSKSNRINDEIKEILSPILSIKSLVYEKKSSFIKLKKNLS